MSDSSWLEEGLVKEVSCHRTGRDSYIPKRLEFSVRTAVEIERIIVGTQRRRFLWGSGLQRRADN